MSRVLMINPDPRLYGDLGPPASLRPASRRTTTTTSDAERRRILEERDQVLHRAINAGVDRRKAIEFAKAFDWTKAGRNELRQLAAGLAVPQARPAAGGSTAITSEADRRFKLLSVPCDYDADEAAAVEEILAKAERDRHGRLKNPTAVLAQIRAYAMGGSTVLDF